MSTPHHRVVVLEGPDGAGKTTLAQTLDQRLGYLRFHEGPPPADRTNVFEYYVESLTVALMHTVVGVTLDRFALGERVYGPLLRGQDRLGGRGWKVMRDLLDAVGALRVLCLPPYDACREAWQHRHRAGAELITDDSKLRATYDAWARLRHDRGQIVYDWTRPGDDEVVLKAVVG